MGELDLERRLWTLPRERVKNDRRHEVPLSSQAVASIPGPAAHQRPLRVLTNAKSPVNDFGKDKGRLTSCPVFLIGCCTIYAALSPAAGAAWYQPSGDRKSFKSRQRLIRRNRGRLSAARVCRREARGPGEVGRACRAAGAVMRLS